jgi:hypothetical protein
MCRNSSKQRVTSQLSLHQEGRAFPSFSFSIIPNKSSLKDHRFHFTKVTVSFFFVFDLTAVHFLSSVI